jgi:general secretion pathway protein F
MPIYRYRAARSDGSLVDGELEAPGPTQTGALLLERGLHPVALKLAPTGASGRRMPRRSELAVVFRSLAALVSAGVPLERALASSEILARGDLRSTLAEARRRLREGQGLAQALEQGAVAIPGVILGLLRAGERGGGLATALEASAAQLELEAELAARVRQALAYPCVLAAAGSLSVLVIGTVILPRFAELLGDLGQQLPPATRALLAVSDFLRAFGLLVLAAAACAGILVLRWGCTSSGRRTVHRLLLGLPVVGPVRHGFATARFTRALGATLGAGMPLLPAVRAATDAAGDAAVAERVAKVEERVTRGEPFAVAVEREQALAGHASQLLAVGESSGRLAQMAQRAGDLAARDAERGLASLITLLEPGLILLFGGMVALTAAALLQAVYSLRPSGM